MTTPIRPTPAALRAALAGHSRPSRAAAALQRSLLAFATLALFAEGAFAQQAAPDATAYAAPQAAGQNVDPPGRVARLNYMAGTVTTEPAGASDWSYAQINRPLTTGDQLWDDKDAHAELHIGSTAVRLGESTSFDVLNLDDTNAQLKVVQGTLTAHVREVPQGGSYEIDTPNLALGIAGPGDYRVDVAPDGSSTTVTIRSGTASVYGDNGQVPLAAGQQVRFVGTALQQVADNRVPPPDGFDTWTESRDAAEDRSLSARYVSRDVPGYQDLDANGTWRNDQQYGAVWVPNAVPTGWAPYHDGHWIWQAPWGWTWVDDQPWGFAPYHYGRWAYVDDSWAWVPGPLVASAPPVYAPALVGFVDGGDSQFNWGVSLAVGGVVAAGVAWFPLGPGEPWHPRWGEWSPHYYQRVNQTVVMNRYNNVTINNVHNTFVNYRAPGAITAVPASAFVHGQPAGRFAQKVDPAQWHNARLQSGAPGLAPVRQSFSPDLRNASYRPPAVLGNRPVVATRGAAVPAAFHDNLAQHLAQGGGRVPGAGDPVVRSSAPAQFAGVAQPGRAAGMPAQNLKIVQSRGPGGAVGAAAGGPVQRGVGAPGAPGTPAGERAAVQAGNGVPRPPQLAQRPGGAAENPARAGGMPNQAAAGPQHGEPSWTQPHQALAQQAGQQRAPGQAMAAQGQQRGAEGAAGAQAPRAPSGMEAQAPRGSEPGQAQAQRAPEQMQTQAQHAPAQMEAQAPRTPSQMQTQPQHTTAQMETQGPHAPTQTQAETPHAPAQMQQVQAPRPQPAQEPQQFHAQAPQQQPQPRAEARPQPQQQARAEFHPQPQQPRQEFHPQPQPQPVREQPREQPRPQPQQAHEQPHPQPQQHEQPRQQANDNHGHDKPHG